MQNTLIKIKLYEILLDRTTKKLFVDYKKKTVISQMSGVMIFDEYQALLLGGHRLESMGKFKNIIIDRKGVFKQDAIVFWYTPS